MDNISSSLDQSLFKDGDMRRQVLENVNNMIDNAETIDDALAVVERLIIISELSGLALAQSLYKIHKKFQVSSDYIFQRIGKTKSTVNRYINVWTLFEEGYIPEEYRNKFLNQNIKNIIPIANTVAQGYDVEEKDWKFLSTAPDLSVVLKYVREKITKKPARSHSLRIYLKRTGDLIIYHGEGGNEQFIGYLELENLNKPAKKAIKRILIGAGIIEL